MPTADPATSMACLESYSVLDKANEDVIAIEGDDGLQYL